MPRNANPPDRSLQGDSTPRGLAELPCSTGIGRSEELCPEYRAEFGNSQYLNLPNSESFHQNFDDFGRKFPEFQILDGEFPQFIEIKADIPVIPPVIWPLDPVVTYRDIYRAISTPRLAAYSRVEDKDCVDAIARYLWNMALGSSMWPTVHLLELIIRNTIYEVGAETAPATKGGPIPCWLTSGRLETRESEEVSRAMNRLGPGRQTPGHLVAELTLGFWVSLCNRPYEHGRSGGLRIWPAAARRFYRCPRRNRNREFIRAALVETVNTRNRIAHHHPVWDRRPDMAVQRLVEVIGWVSEPMAKLALATSTTTQLFAGGYHPFRSVAEKMVTLHRPDF